MRQTHAGLHPASIEALRSTRASAPIFQFMGEGSTLRIPDQHGASHLCALQLGTLRLVLPDSPP